MCVEWIFAAVAYFHLTPSVLYSAVSIMDQFLMTGATKVDFFLPASVIHIAAAAEKPVSLQKLWKFGKFSKTLEELRHFENRVQEMVDIKVRAS